jgi:hypothetical protein
MESNEDWFWERMGDQFHDWDLTGIKLGETTDSNGRIWIVVASLYGGTTVSLYNSILKTYPYLIAQGTRTGTGIVTLSEMNSSGVSGTVVLDSVAASSDIYLDVVQGFLAQVSNMTEYDKFDAQVKALMKELGPNVTAAYEDAMRNLKDGTLEMLRNFVPDKLSTAERSTVMYVETQAADGTVTVEFTGIGKYLINAMDDQTSPAGAQKVAESGPWSFTDSVDPDNVGSGSLSWGPYDHARPGLFTLECVVGGTIGLEEFEVSEKSDDGIRIVGPYRLKTDTTYKSIDLAIHDMTLIRDVTEVSDPENRFSNYTASGVDADNSDNGNLYFRYDKVANVLYVYSDSARTALVAKATGITGPVTANFTEENDSGLSGSTDFNGVDPSTDDYDFQAIVSKFEEGDKIYSQLIEDASFEQAMINTFFGRLFGLVLPSGVNTIPDGIANRGFGRRVPQE